MMKHFISHIREVFTCCLIIFGYFFCAAQEVKGSSVDDKSTSYPQRIVSLGPSITEALYLLEVEDRLVAVTAYCQRPPRAQQKENIGTLKEINLEKIVALEPDIVLAIGLTAEKVKEKLKTLGIPVVTFPAAKSFRQVCEQFLELGRLIGAENKAKEIVRIARRKVNRIKKEIKHLPRQKVFIQVGANPLFAATADFFVNDFIKFAGGINITAHEKSGIYSREKVLESNPDIIIIATMGIVGEREKKIWQGYPVLNAAKNNRIYIQDAYKLCAPTPVTFVETLKEMVTILHPNYEPR